MSSVTLVPNATNSNTGALTGASVSAAWTDSSDTTYVTYDTGELTEVGLSDSTIPAGSVITSIILYAKSVGLVGTTYLSSALETGTDSNVNVVAVLAGAPGPLSAINAWDVTDLSLVDADIDSLVASIGCVGSAFNDLIVYEAQVLVVYYVKPTLTVDSPTGTLTTQNVITVGWTPTFDGSPATTGYEVKVFTDAVYGGGGFDPETSTATLSDSVAGATLIPTSHEFTEPLANDTYRAYVKLTDGRGTDDSDWEYTEFTINVTPPADPTVTLTADPSLARMKIELADGVSATATVSYELQRGEDGVRIPVRVGDGDLTGTDLTIYDYEVRPGIATSFRARAVGANGTVSGWVTQGETLTLTEWWLKNPYAPSLNITAQMRSYPGASRQMRQEIKQPLERADAVVISDTPGPWTGELAVRCSDVDERDALDALLDTAEPLLLQGPSTLTDRQRWISVSAQTRENIIAQWSDETWETLSWTEVARPLGDLTE